MEIVAAQFYCGEIAILGTKCIKDKNCLSAVALRKIQSRENSVR